MTSVSLLYILEENSVSEELSYCGYRCDLCAARSDDAGLRQQMVDLWRKYLGHQNYTAENVRCNGCRAGGLLADKGCPVRPCAIEKGVETCAHCDEYPCDKLKPLLGSRTSFFERFPDATEAEFNLCYRQFDSESRLEAVRRSLGKD